MDPASATNPIPLSHDDELAILYGNAAYLFGSQGSWLLLAFIMTQLYTYYKNSKNDNLLIKTMVYGSVVFQIAATVLDTFVAYRVLVRDWGNLGDVLSPNGDPIGSAVSNLITLEDGIRGYVSSEHMIVIQMHLYQLGS